ncbi:hypothetical protein TEA_000029 [Camellia sinensis var. sinensis]|uniref:Importin N-terminal domain-containing protein n=1 Tax=Camellia sinensis var. sinensis TaxID=542762 RepID=A0A4S4E8V7_CAMSN|nr:hypothetical protein TEA_000029 [Camellia sinensis var. sinensis]
MRQDPKLLQMQKWICFNKSWKRNFRENVCSRRNLDKYLVNFSSIFFILGFKSMVLIGDLFVNSVNTVITNEISDLENQRASVEERREILRKLEQDEMRAQMKLSMYASVTNIIPNLHENSKISGCATNYTEFPSSSSSALSMKLLVILVFSVLEKMALEITQFLLSAQSADAKVRTEAEGNLRQFQEQNLPSFFLSLSVELSNNDKPIESHRLAGVLLKNSLDAKDASRKEHLVQQWVTIDISVKSKIKDLLLNTLGSSAPEARHTSSQVIAKIAAIEIPRKEWPELIGSLLVNMSQQDRPASLKQATLETLGYICEEISHQDLVQDEVNSVLTAVVQGMNVAQHSPEVRLAATRALYNALDFAQSNFENEM